MKIVNETGYKHGAQPGVNGSMFVPKDFVSQASSQKELPVLPCHFASTTEISSFAGPLLTTGIFLLLSYDFLQNKSFSELLT